MAVAQDRALAVQRDEANAGIGVALADAFGEQSHPGPRGNRQQHPVDLTVWHLDQRRRNSGGATGRQDSVIKRPIGIAGKHDDALWSDLLQADVWLHGVLVTDGEHRDGALLAERCHAKSGRRNGQRNDRDIQLACSHRVGQARGPAPAPSSSEVGRGGDETPQSSRDAGPESGGDVADPQHRPGRSLALRAASRAASAWRSTRCASGSSAAPASVRATLRCVRSNSRTPSSSSSLRTCSETAG